ncbi:MAG: endonuclease [Longimicrobiaceae bacterium]
MQLEAAFDARQRAALSGAATAGAGHRSRLVAELRTSEGYDCEHVVPRRWFKTEGDFATAEGDLHHLFTCDRPCNNFRGNVPFWDFPDWEGTGCGKKEGDRFEPARGKGPAARAVLYFLLRYPGQIDDLAGELRAGRIDTLLAWHEREPPAVYELHRNAAIFARQGNRNPLIDFPAHAQDIPFHLGLGH